MLPHDDVTVSGVTLSGDATRPGTLDRDETSGGVFDPDITRAGAASPAAPGAGTGTQHGPLTPGQAFGGRYHIVRLLGVGGMGAVYQAWDEELGVVVALKVIRPEAAGDPETAQALERRFKQELLLARQVTHKNVVRIHDLGEVNGIKYITMPFVQGEDLASILHRVGPLPLPRVLKIARTMVSGLVAAQAAGVVHRDLKPANLMIDADGEALIMDFGIARSTGARPGADGHGFSGAAVAGQTVVGAVVGTIEYMAPEQAQAQPVDHRADLYAAGLIMYDMLGGRIRLERAESVIADLTSRILAPPPSLTTIDPAIPPPIDRIVRRCLQPDPAARYQTAQELLADLDAVDDRGHLRPRERRLTRRWALSAAAVFAAALSLTWWTARGPAPVVQPKPISVLIADFENGTGDPVFAGAVEQALSIALEGASFISAYPRPQARKVAEQLQPGATLDDKTAYLIARRDGVDVLVTGKIQRDGERYTISARTLDPAAEGERAEPLATAEASAASKAAVLETVARVASRLRRELGDTASAADREKPTETFTAASVDAMRAYVRGQDLQVAGKLPEALLAYQQAVAFDSGFGRAYNGMAGVYSNLKQSAKAEESFQQALKHLNRMTEREKYATLGGYYLLISRNYENAIENYEALVSKYPADRAGHANLALAYVNVRKVEKAVAGVRKALELEPTNLLQRMNYAIYSMYAGDFKTAIAESRKVPTDSWLHAIALFTIVRAAAAAEDWRLADATLGQLAAAGSYGRSFAATVQADLAMYAGRSGSAVEILRASAAAAESAGDRDDAAGKLLALAEALAARGQWTDAKTAALRATQLTGLESVLFPAALLLSELGDEPAADALARRLDDQLQTQTRSYAGLIRAQLALQRNDLPAAMQGLRDARHLFDSWSARWLLARASFEAGQYPEALAELELCLKRKGELTDVFVADSATLRYLPPVYYWLGRAQEALQHPDARENYRRYVQIRQHTDTADPLLADARARLKALDPAAH